MHQVTCKNCHKEFDGVMGICGGGNTFKTYKCTHCQHIEMVKHEPIDWLKALKKASEK